jgi:pilus assembly protein Flp/PilA
MKRLLEFIKREDGVTAPEYALIAALVAVVIIAAVTLLGSSVQAGFEAIANAFGGGTGG